MLRTKLLHRDHPESPLSPANATASLRERFAAAVRRSNERRDAIERKLCGTLASNSEFQSPVVWSNSGEYLMTLNLGTPAQNFNSVVDTGSDLVWVQCTPCVSCYTQTGALFDSSKSSSYSVSSCTDSLCSEVSNFKALAHIQFDPFLTFLSSLCSLNSWVILALLASPATRRRMRWPNPARSTYAWFPLAPILSVARQSIQRRPYVVPFNHSRFSFNWRGRLRLA